jgi:glycosyltransferase involved in cell wall biosynthesis
LHELMSNAALFVLPSEVEGLPTVLLEAMSYGNCCLASDIPENVEALAGLGYTFRSRDVEALAAALRHLATDSEARLRPTERAKRHVAHNHSWDAIALALEGFYARTLGWE